MRQTMHLPSKLPCFVKTMALKTSSATGLGGEGRILLSEKGAHCPLRARQPQRCSHLSAECCPPQVPAQSLGPGQKRPLRVPTPTRCLNLASYLRLLVKIQIQGSIAALCIFELQMLPYLQSLLLRFSVRLVISTALLTFFADHRRSKTKFFWAIGTNHIVTILVASTAPFSSTRSSHHDAAAYEGKGVEASMGQPCCYCCCCFCCVHFVAETCRCAQRQSSSCRPYSI